MSNRCFHRVLEGSEMELAARLVMFCLADRADDDGFCWPSIKRLAADARVDYRTARRCLARAEAAGEVVVRRAPGRRTEFVVAVGMTAEELREVCVARFGLEWTEGNLPRVGEGDLPYVDKSGTEGDLPRVVEVNRGHSVQGGEGILSGDPGHPVPEPRASCATGTIREPKEEPSGREPSRGREGAGVRDGGAPPSGEFDADVWLEACRLAGLIEGDFGGEKFAEVSPVGAGGVKRAMGIAYLAEWHGDGMRFASAAIEAIVAARGMVPAAGTALMDLRRYEDGAYPNTKGRVAASRVEAAARAIERHFRGVAASRVRSVGMGERGVSALTLAMEGVRDWFAGREANGGREVGCG